MSVGERAALRELLLALESGSRPKGGVKGIESGVPSLGGEHLDANGGFRLDRVRYVPREFAASMRRGKIAVGDVLVVKDGATTGKVALVRDSFPHKDAVVNEHVFLCRCDERVDPRYVFWYLYSAEGQREILSDFRGAAQGGISQRFADLVQVPLRPIGEQRRIVAEIEKQFSRLDEAVANLKRVKANLDRYVGATLGEAFSGKWAGTEADWQSVPLREVADVQLGQQRAPVHAADANPIPYVRAANVSWQGLDLSDVKSMGFPNTARYRLAYGDILLAEASGSANEVGKPAIWRDEIPGACYQKTLIRVRCQPDRLNFEFAYYFFLHAALSGQFARLAPGVGILHPTAERMLVWPTVAPTLRIQAVVVSEVDRRLSIVREVEAEVDGNLMRAQALRQAVLAKAFAA